MSSPRSPDRALVRLWLPVVGWAALISLFSTGWFSNEQTGRVFIPLLHWLFPSFPLHALQDIHRSVRKAAHVTEYFILSWLIHRRLRQEGWRPLRAATASLVVSVAYACIDELHQVFVPGRTATWGDVGIDSLGAAAGQLLQLAQTYFGAPSSAPAEAQRG